MKKCALISIILLVGCEGSSLPVNSCADDMDCLNGYRCGALNMCERTMEVSDAGVLPIEDSGTEMGNDSGTVDIPDSGMMAMNDSGMVTETDSGMMAMNDSGMVTETDSGIDSGTVDIPDSGMMAMNDSGTDSGMPDSGILDTWLRFDGGVATSESIILGTTGATTELTVELWLNFDGARAPQRGDIILSAESGRFKVEVVYDCPWAVCGEYLSCTYVDRWNGNNRLLAPIERSQDGWHHISCTRRVRGPTRMMIDGILAAEDVSGHSFYTIEEPSPIIISFIGSIDGLVFAPAMRFENFIPPDRLSEEPYGNHFYPMNEGSGNRTSDLVGVADFTLSGSVSWAP